jgi:hypothetical protein
VAQDQQWLSGGVSKEIIPTPILYDADKKHNHIKTLNLHNIQLDIRILRKTAKYENQLKKSNKISLMDCTILLYKNKIEVFTQRGLCFESKCLDDCYSQALNHFAILYGKIENRLNIIINKDQYLNKKWVRQHIAECDSEIAKHCNENKTRLIVYSPNGKQRVITDNSFKHNHQEFISSETAKSDTEKWKEFIYDVLRNDLPKLSDVWKVTATTVSQQRLFDVNIQLHLSVMQDIKTAIQELRDVVKINGLPTKKTNI